MPLPLVQRTNSDSCSPAPIVERATTDQSAHLFSFLSFHLAYGAGVIKFHMMLGEIGTALSPRSTAIVWLFPVHWIHACFLIWKVSIVRH